MFTRNRPDSPSPNRCAMPGLLCGILLLAVAAEVWAEPVPAPLATLKVDWPAYLAQHDLVWQTLPQPGMRVDL